ncbi:hypothetical protein TNCV_2729571 [Trichonephila clavipes]|nr:hypothetical protein TNCV_2729571 [Trichonephila clavipes]
MQLRKPCDNISIPRVCQCLSPRSFLEGDGKLSSLDRFNSYESLWTVGLNSPRTKTRHKERQPLLHHGHLIAVAYNTGGKQSEEFGTVIEDDDGTNVDSEKELPHEQILEN